MDQNKRWSVKTKKATLVAVIVILIISALFVSRSYLVSRVGIFASTEGGETISVIDSAVTIGTNGSTLMNNVKVMNEKLVLDDVAKPGYVEGILSASNSSDKITRYIANVNLPTGCSGTAILQIKPAYDSSGQSYSGDWLTQNSTSYVVSSPAILTNQQAKFKVIFTPCSGGAI